MSKQLDLTHLDASYTRKLNEIAMCHKKKYTEFVDKYSKKYGKCYLWWALPFSSRNIYLDRTFQNICYLNLCGRIIRDDKELRHIVVSDRAIYKTILVNYGCELSDRKIVIECVEHGLHIGGVVKRFFRGFRKLISIFLRVRWYSRHEKYDIRDSLSLLDISVLSSDFSNGKYQDRYFSNIQDYVKKNIYYLASLEANPSISWKEYINYIRNSRKYRFILKEKFLNIFDYFFLIKYFAYSFQLSFKKYKYDNLDVTPLVRDSLLKGSFCMPALKGILNYRFIKHFKRKNFKVDNLISWYEGRPSDVMLHKAFREYYEGVNCVGYEGYPLSEFALSQYLSSEQLRQKSAPLKIGIPGTGYEKMAKQFSNKVECINVPILRNRYESSNKEKRLSNGKVRLLVVLPYFIDCAGIMLRILNRYMQTKQDDFQIIIKNHPINGTMKIEDYIKEKFNFTPTYVTGELRSCLYDIDVAYTSYSTASLEVISQGVFLINLCPQGKLRDTGIPDKIDERYYKMVYDDLEVFETLDMVLQKKNEKIDIINVAELLEKISEETVNRMWN